MVTPEQIENLVKMVFAAYPYYSKKNEFETVCDLYYLTLSDEDYSKIRENLKNYIRNNGQYAPNPKDLLNGLTEEKHSIPSLEETTAYLETLKPKEKLSRERIMELAKEVGVVAKFKD